MEELLAPFHPQIVHTPIALIIVGALFEIVGRVFDLEWWRKAAFAMLIVGVIGAWAGTLSGHGAEEVVEDRGVPHDPIEAHEDAATLAFRLGIAAVLARAIAGRTGRARPVVAGLALVLHLATAVTVGVASHRGGVLVYEHGANVKVNGEPVTTPAPEKSGEHREGEREGRQH